MVYLILSAKEAERRAYIKGYPDLALIYAGLPPREIVRYPYARAA